ncbi:hypothetical protein AAL_08119 [Moelleriella libera RCEF 2490]|uniref:Nucleotide-diphospho-sugar transferase domain-containing protein n=1 Tax=Moelleriella libera RCEF 2490 TaxID=1081109 RepID=A0A167W3H7_9HYPO|nr:hypothetical protein AAL_08119 [Moelleriella libera RCEF 2490]
MHYTPLDEFSKSKWSLSSFSTRKLRLRIATVAMLMVVAVLLWTQAPPIPLAYYRGRLPFNKASTQESPEGEVSSSQELHGKEHSTQDSHVRGIPSEDLATFARHAINNTVVIVPVNTGMLQFAENLLCSLEAISFDTSDLVFWALDEGAKRALDSKNRTTYYDSRLWSVSSDENKHGNTGDYRRMMKERPWFFIDLLSAGYDMLMLDADIVFWRSPLLLVPNKNEKVDIVYSTDARDFYTEHNAFDDARRRGDLFPPICNGLFWMRSSKDNIGLWSHMLDVFESTDPETQNFRDNVFMDDQRGMDVMLNDKGRAKIVEPYPEGITQDMLPAENNNATLNVRLLDQTEVANGQLVMFHEKKYLKKLAKLRATGKERIAVHMNWDTGAVTKEDGAKQKNIWYWDGEKCKYPK